MSRLCEAWPATFFRCWYFGRVIIQEYFIRSDLHHVQASTLGLGSSPVVMSVLLGTLSDSSTFAPFSLVLSRTDP